MTAASRPTYFRGEWLQPGDADYDEMRRKVFNMRHDPHPPIIARCLGNADVAAALAYARETGQEVAVRSTGWSLEGHSATDGVTIDLSLMRAVSVDPVSRTAWVQGGATAGDLQVEGAPFNLAAATGLFSGSGVGLLLSGGVGHLSRRVGHASFSILAAEIVTASGEIILAAPEMNPDLFWAVPGTQGNFGVVTAFQLQMYEVPEVVLAGELNWHGARIGDALRALADAAEWASDDLSMLAFLEPGKASMKVCHLGARDLAESELARLIASGAPDESAVAPTSFRDLTFSLDGNYAPMRVALDHEVRATGLSDVLIESIERRLEAAPAGRSDGLVLIEAHPCFRGMSRAPLHPNAIRSSSVDPYWTVFCVAAWASADDDEAYQQWVLESTPAIRSAADDSGVLSPGFGIQTVGSAAASFGANLPRLRELKRKWDPDNVFRANLNIAPADD